MSQELKDGIPMNPIGFDEPSLELVEEKPIMPESRSTGGPTYPVLPTNR
jgi:hypothetical protein